VNNDFHGIMELENTTSGINSLAKKGLHTMIGVIDAENQSSITFHENLIETVGTIKSRF
jgi:phosphinothricin acetyltransferase